jgi:hypothetical protein
LSELPWWVEGRDTVVAAADPAEWRDGAPEYALSNEHIPNERTHQHAPDSLEAIVERVVQVFEVEVTHKHDPATWVSVVKEHFRTNVNGGAWATPADIIDVGSYNLFIGDNNPFYPAGVESFASSHDVFHTALPTGFFWEVLEVFTGPPTVTFKWRHWGKFEGEYKGTAPTGETIEMFGMTVAKVNDDLRLLQVEHYYDPSQLLSKLAGGCPVARG